MVSKITSHWHYMTKRKNNRQSEYIGLIYRTYMDKNLFVELKRTDGYREFIGIA